ncbi:MAG: deoxyhypusine synthase [Acidilobaceae archaeon]|nr:deoxyhypusine synthase [Acidilobaceae archaeon]MCX8165668.1 deoxyhypusine synthase [Acidilobaceae archaeon]MDW7974093.1 deoxyhypusine synthase [Sulfolobales archaeon]
MELVKDVRISKEMRLCELVEAFGQMHGFTASSLYKAVEVLREGIRVSDLRILTFTGNLIATGLRGVIAQLLEGGLFNVVFTTTGAIDHDIARSSGGRYLKGYFDADDTKLKELDMFRLGNIFIPSDSYGELVEAFTAKLVDRALGRKRWATFELLKLAGEMIEDQNSILRAARIGGAEIFLPGWPDGAFGTALFMEGQKGKKIEIDYFLDMSRLADIFFSSKRAVALIVGGGISKHHALWWSQFKGGLEYAVYVTTSHEADGSLSGARPREAVSWGKISPSAKTAAVIGDATIVLPLIAPCLML